jgi:hypothetical protein
MTLEAAQATAALELVVINHSRTNSLLPLECHCLAVLDFLAQPELCGELVDLLQPTVSSGNIACGAAAVAVPSENGVKLLEEEVITQFLDSNCGLSVHNLHDLVWPRDGDVDRIIMEVKEEVNVQTS